MGPGRGIDFRNKAAAFLRGGSPGKNTIRLPLREEGNYLTRLMCHCLEVSHSGLLHLGATGVCRKPAKRRRGTRYFCDVSSSHELRTNPPARGGSAKSWNAGGVATSPEGRCAGSCSLEGLEGVSHPAPRSTTTVPAADLAGHPDLIEKEAPRLMPQFRKLVGDHHPHAPHPGRIRIPGRP